MPIANTALASKIFFWSNERLPAPLLRPMNIPDLSSERNVNRPDLRLELILTFVFH
ncbi:hypothetical protein [Caballeronia sordidicola]|uniref:hypothetical protein n=1 Tax=Caballeronia sordidicola TaxID=196367 RepID=UPI001FC9A784|nr:hypothetical protein [Caballeronia sordidicola]